MEPDLVLLPRVAHLGHEITSRRLRDLLALLAFDHASGASTRRLLDGLWPDQPPEHPGKALQVLVSRARTLLGADTIAGTPTGYRLALPPERVDVGVLRRTAATVRTAGPVPCLAEVEQALALWDGQVDAADEGPLTALRTACLPVHAALVRAKALGTARTGRGAEALDLLTRLTAEHPADEEVLAELLRAEAATLGPAAALSRYERHRRRLRDDLGTDPGPTLQAVHADLLRADTPVVRQGVAHEPNQLLGRDHDLAAVAALLRGSRVVSVVGAGGLGKTRLAHAVARQAPQRIVRLVGLAGVTRDADVPGEVASVVAGPARYPGPVDPLTSALDALGADGLLVLDNCEHVLDGAADLVSALVARSRDVRVLVTSRAPLGLSSEAVHPLPPLQAGTAAELFAQRARAARPDVALPPDAVAELCARLDGLPLAIELAAARVRTLSVPEIAERMADRFGLLRGTARDAPTRHRTLHAVVDWSWALLSPTDRVALAGLSIFPDGFNHAAARRLGAAESLEQLVDQSLLSVAETPDGVRYRMLETVREFAAPHRDEGCVEAFLGWARELCLTEHDALVGPEPYQALRSCRAEQDNLLLALRLAIGRRDGATVAATAAVLEMLWTVENNFGRVLALTAETAEPLSHLRPGPELIEVIRTAAALDAANRLAVQGPRANRGLVTLRRLPPAPPDTTVRGLAAVLGRPTAEVLRLCDSPQPAVAAAANGLATYLHEAAGDPEAALAAARRMAAVTPTHPLFGVLAHSRMGELLLLFEHGAQALAAFRTATQLYRRLAPADLIGLRWALVQAAMQAEEVDEAERLLDAAVAAEGHGYGSLTMSIALRAEIQLARGDVDQGLALWRRTIEALAEEPVLPLAEDAPDPWGTELRATSLVAHARHGHHELVPGAAEELAEALAGLLAHPLATPLPSFPELTVCGVLLVAVAAADLADLAAQPGARATTARMIALAERFHYPHNFHPTMASARVRADAQAADATAYAAAARAYADLAADRYRATALELLARRREARDQRFGSRV